MRFLREHRSEWADPGVDAYSAAALRASPYAVPGLRASGFMGSQVILPLAHTLEHEEVFQVSSSSSNCIILTMNNSLFIRLVNLLICSSWRLLGLRDTVSVMMKLFYQEICIFCRYVFM